MKILIAIDGSQVSHHEVQYALQLVRNGLRASVVLANVQESPSTYERLTAQGNEEMLANVAFGGSVACRFDLVVIELDADSLPRNLVRHRAIIE